MNIYVGFQFCVLMGFFYVQICFTASIYASLVFALTLFVMLVVSCPETFGFLIFLFNHCSLYACFLTRDRTGVYSDGREGEEGYIKEHHVRTDF